MAALGRGLARGSGPHGGRGPAAVPAVFPGGPAHPAAVSRDAARDLRSRLTELTVGVRPRVFVVAAPPGVEAAAPVASRLAKAWAHHGGRTLRVDAVLATPTLDARYPAARRAAAAGGRAVASTLAWLAEPDGDHGVATVAGEAGVTLDLAPQLRPIWLAPGTAAAFFAGLRRALRRWDRYDAIVILAPSLTTGGDARWIVPHATGVVLVVDGTRSTRRAIDEARRARRARRCSASW